jgi:hypothetical protein
MLLKQDKLLMVLPRLVKKGHLKIMLYQGGGDKNTHTWDRWTCANGKEWSRGTKEVLIIGLHMVGKMSMDLLNLEILKFLMHFRKPGRSFYFIFTHTHIFSHTYIFYFFLFLFSLSHFFLFFFLIKFFLFAPLWTLKLHCTYLLPHA